MTVERHVDSVAPYMHTGTFTPFNISVFPVIIPISTPTGPIYNENATIQNRYGDSLASEVSNFHTKEIFIMLLETGVRGPS